MLIDQNAHSPKIQRKSLEQFLRTRDNELWVKIGVKILSKPNVTFFYINPHQFDAFKLL